MRNTPVKPVDEERSQSHARLGICAISLVGFGIIAATQDFERSRTLVHGFATILGYLGFAALWHLIVLRWPGRAPGRRYVAMTADLAIMVFWMYLGDRYVTAYYPIFLWVIIGNGIRFGPRFMAIGMSMGALGFGSLLLFDAYWRAHQGLGLGLLMGVVVLPVFFLTVLRRLRAVARLEVELARSRLADRAKDQFLSVMSHELRTPMNGVLGLAQMLGEADLPEEQREQVEIIERSVESLLNIVSNILDCSKIASDQLRLEPQPFDLKLVLQDVLALLTPAAREKGIEFEFTFPDGAQRGFHGDPARLRQIVANLLGNAIKFTRAGRVRLACAVSGRGDRGRITLSISDTGVGIPARQLATIFDPFEQGDRSTTRENGGSGLGLAISHQLTELMGGTIAVESVEGEGSTFTVELELETCALENTTELTVDPPLPSFPLRALVVEDNRINQRVASKLLSRLGMHPEIAENGAEALEMLERADYDLIFMDIRMPVMDGYQATRRIRARGDSIARIPIVALTAESTSQARQRALAVGMDEFLSKPVQIQQIVAAVEGCLRPEREPVA